MGWFISCDPTSLDTREGRLGGVAIDAKVKRATGHFGVGSLENCTQPANGLGVVVLREDTEGTPSSVFSWGKVCTKKEKILSSHIFSEATKKRERI